MRNDSAMIRQAITRFAQLVVTRPRLVIALVSVVTLVLGLGLRRGIELDVSPLSFIEQGSTARADFERTRSQFGDDKYLIVAVVCDDVFAPANLAKLHRLHRQIATVPGVGEVLSLSNVPYARSLPDGVSAERLVPEGALDAARLDEARRVATTDRLFVGNLVSADAKTAAFNILLKSELSTAQRYTCTKEIYQRTRNAGFDASFFAGDPFSQWRGVTAIQGDLRVFLPLTLLLLVGLLWVSFRSLAAILLPLLAIGLGVLWLVGLMAWFNAHFTILGLMLPTLMLAIGCSYLIHVLNQIGIETVQSPQLALSLRLQRALCFITLPVIVSALTIIAGFLSLALTKIPAIRATAVYAACGAAFTMLLSLTFVPAVLVLLGERTRPFRIGLSGSLGHWLKAIGLWATAHQRFLYVVTVLIAVISVVGIWRVKIDVDYFHFFKADSEPSIGLAEINRRLLGAVSFDIIVEGRAAGAIEDADVLRRIDELQAFAEKQSQPGAGIDRTLSVVDFVKHLNRAFHQNEASHYVIPNDNRVLQELLSDRDQLKGFLTPDGRHARVLVRSNLSGSTAMAGTIAAVEQRARELLPEFRVYATGTFVLLNRTSDQIGREQVQSITLALVTIYLMLSVLFKSLRVGFTALVPNLIPVLFFFGFMGWRGIPLNLTTSLVASLVLGLAVDNAVQFVIRFRRVQQSGHDLREAIITSMWLSGRPIIYANIALAVTFAIFAVSNFAPVASFGLLSAVTIIGCLIEDLVLLPSRLTSPIFRAK
jgi:predicted RND superfamily exporter protein